MVTPIEACRMLNGKGEYRSGRYFPIYVCKIEPYQVEEAIELAEQMETTIPVEFVFREKKDDMDVEGKLYITPSGRVELSVEGYSEVRIPAVSETLRNINRRFMNVEFPGGLYGNCGVHETLGGFLLSCVARAEVDGNPVNLEEVLEKMVQTKDKMLKDLSELDRAWAVRV